MTLAARHAQVLADQIRHGWRTRAPYYVPAEIEALKRRITHLRWSGLDAPACVQLARQDRIRLRALCAGLRALRETPQEPPWVRRARRLGRARRADQSSATEP